MNDPYRGAIRSPFCLLEVTGYGGVVLAPGNVLAVSFSNITVPQDDVNITG